MLPVILGVLGPINRQALLDDFLQLIDPAHRIPWHKQRTNLRADKVIRTTGPEIGQRFSIR
jgi:hypothetical protein